MVRNVPSPTSSDLSGVPPELIGMFKQWKPEFQEKALDMLRGFEKADWHPFFCKIRECDGNPHADGTWDWQHARVDQRPPNVARRTG